MKASAVSRHKGDWSPDVGSGTTSMAPKLPHFVERRSRTKGPGSVEVAQRLSSITGHSGGSGRSEAARPPRDSRDVIWNAWTM